MNTQCHSLGLRYARVKSSVGWSNLIVCWVEVLVIGLSERRGAGLFPKNLVPPRGGTLPTAGLTILNHL